ncbi:MAG: N-succinylarginine dihydrolase [Deltaproteobacteria bacterium]|nr:N-succinylarginine dihydrolase [Deltaproteobacteria bacterium]
MSAIELNFDGIVGPTHNYAGLAHGNVASTTHRGLVSSPRAGALQGLAKAKLLADLGVPQAVVPPQERPDVAALKALGFEGSDAEALHQAAREAPRLLAAVASASSMWTANAATVSPSADTRDERVHFTPANLVAHLHRSLEPALVGRVLHRIFPDPAHFAHHAPLAATVALGDEGAANHTRLCADFGRAGVELFVYGRDGLDDAPGGAARFDTRQTREASEAVVRLHRLDRARVVVARQDPAAVDAGAFHNDVVAVGHRNVLLAHERAWVDGVGVADRLARRFAEVSGGHELVVCWVGESELSLADSVGCYLFNSQLVTVGDGTMALIAPIECQERARARAVIERLVGGPGPIAAVHYVDLRQSMRNGGGPACLRLRVELTDAERARMETGTLLTNALHARLVAWVEKHYRDRLEAAELADCSLLDESRTALDELTGILGLGSIYPFQLAGA